MKNFFRDARPGSTVSHGEATFELPILYHRDDLFMAFYSADAREVEALLPSPRLHPARLPFNRALVGVAAFNYTQTSIGPYGEVAVALPVVYGSRRPITSAAALLQGHHPGFGSVVLHLPVTRLAARDAGRGEWGYPKFVADMQFTLTPERMTCQLDEGARSILTLEVPRTGFIHRDRQPLVTYSVRDGDLVKTVIPQQGIARTAIRPRGARLLLGDHPMADTLRALKLSERPLMTRHYLSRSAILPAGVVIESNARPLEGHIGQRQEGQLTAKYLERGA